MFSARASSHDITCKPSPAPSLSIFIFFGAWGDPGTQADITLTTPTQKQPYNSQHSFLPNIISVPKEPSLLGVNPYKVRVVLSKLIHAARVNICRPGVIHGPSTAKPSSCHVHCTLWVTPPTLPLSHLFYWHMQAQCAWCSSLCTWAMQSCLVINLWWSTRQNFIIPYSRKLLRGF